MMSKEPKRETTLPITVMIHHTKAPRKWGYFVRILHISRDVM